MGVPDAGTNRVPPEVRLVGDAASLVNVPLIPPRRWGMFGIRYPNIGRKAIHSPTFCEASNLVGAGETRCRRAVRRRIGRHNLDPRVARDRSAAATAPVDHSNDRFAPTR